VIIESGFLRKINTDDFYKLWSSLMGYHGGEIQDAHRCSAHAAWDNRRQESPGHILIESASWREDIAQKDQQS
jgi:beta-lactamase class D